jgi:hypothetical protein
MERIVYRKTLDVHKNGVQFTLQGFETADNLSRVIELSLMSSGDAIDFPLEKLTALMYITSPGDKVPSINACEINDNKVVYEVLPILVEGTTYMQLKLIETSVDGAKAVLISPQFAIEVMKSNVDDSNAEKTTTFTALEDAVAKARSTFDERLIRVEVDKDCTFRAYYADGSVYETDAINECIMKAPTVLSKSYAMGDTGAREGEASDNSKYYSNVSRSSAIEAREDGDHATDLLTEVRKHGVYTSFGMDFETGELLYSSPKYNFSVDTESGDLTASGEDYSFEEALRGMLAENMAEDVAQIISETIAETILNMSEANPNIAVYADDLTKDFGSPTLVRWDSLTKHSPYAALLTTITEGFAIVHGQINGNHTVIAWATGEENNYFCHTVSGGTDKGWNGYLSKSGGTLTGSLGINGGKGKIDANDEYSIYEARKDADNARQIKVSNPITSGIPLSDAVKLADIVGGVSQEYKLFGEHNITDLISKFNLGQIEYGTFNGIGQEAINSGILPSIEFTKISPVLVIVLEYDGWHIFSPCLSRGYGRRGWYHFDFHQTWSGNKLTIRCGGYTSTPGSMTYPQDLPNLEYSDLKNFLAFPSTTYFYIGIGGGNNA